MVMEVIHPKCRLVPKNSKARLPTLLPDITCTYFLQRTSARDTKHVSYSDMVLSGRRGRQHLRAT
jgi:hypothetical protein